MSDLYHGEYPVDMTVNEARREVARLEQAQQLLRDPKPHEQVAAKAHEYVRSGDYRTGYLAMCEAYGKLNAVLDALR